MKWDTPQSRELFRVILSLKSINETQRFFRDLLTEEEIIEFTKRWQVANLLYDGVPYSEIQKQTGMSSTTVARISKSLNSGMNGYQTMIQRTHHAKPSPPEKSFG